MQTWVLGDLFKKNNKNSLADRNRKRSENTRRPGDWLYRLNTQKSETKTKDSRGSRTHR